jgi:hypothetical protein
MAVSKEFKFALGDVVRDKVTEFEGAIVSRGDHISGCNTYGIQPTQLKDGAPQDTKWFDEPRLIATGRSLGIVDNRTVRTGADSIPQRTHV